MRAEHAPEARLVAPNLWPSLGTHVVASPGSHGAREGGGLSVHSFPLLYLLGGSEGEVFRAARLIDIALGLEL